MVEKSTYSYHLEHRMQKVLYVLIQLASKPGQLMMDPLRSHILMPTLGSGVSMRSNRPACVPTLLSGKCPIDIYGFCSGPVLVTPVDSAVHNSNKAIAIKKGLNGLTGSIVMTQRSTVIMSGSMITQPIECAKTQLPFRHNPAHQAQPR